MFYKKGQTSTDTPIILSIFAFQAFLVVMLGFLNITPETQSVTGFGFTQNIISNISLLGWGNTILFTPLVVGLGYIILKLIRGGG